jgi:hypothetical protein
MCDPGEHVSNKLKREFNKEDVDNEKAQTNETEEEKESRKNKKEAAVNELFKNGLEVHCFVF